MWEMRSFFELRLRRNDVDARSYFLADGGSGR